MDDPRNTRNWALTSFWAFSMDVVAAGLIFMVLSSFSRRYNFPQKRLPGGVVLGLGSPQLRPVFHWPPLAVLKPAPGAGSVASRRVQPLGFLVFNPCLSGSSRVMFGAPAAAKASFVNEPDRHALT